MIDHAYLHGHQSGACCALVRTPDGGTFEFCGHGRFEHAESPVMPEGPLTTLVCRGAVRLTPGENDLGEPLLKLRLDEPSGRRSVVAARVALPYHGHVRELASRLVRAMDFADGNGNLSALAERIVDAERRVSERDAAGYETPTAAIARLAHARTEWANGRRGAMVAEGFLEADELRPFVETITRDLDRFDDILRAQHAADVGPAEDEEPQC